MISLGYYEEDQQVLPEKLNLTQSFLVVREILHSRKDNKSTKTA